ncbi:MAG: class I SAM-dependent methyltransferase [Pseudomonadota bacterium]|nr:class I SAM-dependent methyltransferase [Desulfobacterales bacterium]MBL6967929.1 class I SAM-dependent methyltransferase [Desulfobacteraceae bacterium]MBL7172829.1 class I SAM-dependent methyltransferase [Desulfobacteraceae bacterium]
MGTPFQRFSNHSQPEPHLADYTSTALPLFLESLERVQGCHVLDVGSVCGDNIRFFAQRVKRLYICDMFFHLGRVPRGDPPPGQIWTQMDFPPRTFHGILLWNLIDHLDDGKVGRVVEVCHDMMRPGGMVFVSLMGKMAEPVMHSFVIRPDYRLHIRPDTAVHLPLHVRNNREAIALLAPFRLTKSFLYQNGVRELLLKRD